MTDLRAAMQGLQERAIRAKQAREEAASAAAEPPAPADHRQSQHQIRLSIEQFQRNLVHREFDGRFEAYPIRPGSEFPTFLTRIPIFLPTKRGRNKQPLDADNALTFTTSWGRGRKHGPPLTIYDEDTLIALARLRKTRLQGQPQHMPIPLSAVQPSQNINNDIAVHVLSCTLSDVQALCDDSTGGANMQLRLASLKRLGATVIELDRQTKDKIGYRGTQFKFLDIAWDVYERDAMLLIQFSPLMAAWFEHEYTFVDWTVRRELSDTGKALHRFLCSQPKHYSMLTLKLMPTIGYQRSYKHFMDDLRTTMKKMQALGWLDHWEITGTGRKQPHKLTLSR
ncbi:MAG: hypothetical protein FD165_2658 [Gammaproteobacteria bacterium]|nr:MAG: hypothetical protein FD165_2658 [Gammaproteobacteria bacterium]TND01132.1 MAG: hypothetical protein FD120_2668 [Gammaproteobacteria bacterium]